jgi:uncharacterized protein (TIGR03437 family)
MTGRITTLASPILASGAVVSIGGVTAQVVYAGAAPQEVAGLVQVNVVVPESIAPGTTVPITLNDWRSDFSGRGYNRRAVKSPNHSHRFGGSPEIV